MNVLYILRHNPWGIGGGCYASHCYLNAFTKIFEDAQMDVCLCGEYLNDNQNDNENQNGNVNFVKVQERSKVEKAISPVTGLLHRFDSTARKMLKSKHYDYCIFDHSSIAGPLAGLCRILGVKSIVINHNCEYEYYRDNHSRIERAVFLRHVRNAERMSYLGCDYNIFLTEEDKVLFEKLYGMSGTRSIVTGCFDHGDGSPDHNRLTTTDQENRPHDPRIVISGTIGNVQNMDGINFFLKELLPCVPKDAEVIIAGKNPPATLSTTIEILNQTGNNALVTLIPNPEDMLSIVSRCNIFLCPTRLGGGLKLRVMDGLRVGLPVIAHQVSARGYSEFKKAGMLWAFESQDEFRQALTTVISHLQEGDIKKEVIQMFANQQFSFEEKVKALKSICYR